MLAALTQSEEHFDAVWAAGKDRFHVADSDFFDYTKMMETVAPIDWWRHTQDTDMQYRTSIEIARDDALAQGMQQGMQKGILAVRRSIIELARTRGLRLSSDSQTRLNACADIDQLSAWLTQVATADKSPLTLVRAKG